MGKKHHSPPQANDLRFNDMPPSPNNLGGGMVPYIELLACSDGEAKNPKLQATGVVRPEAVAWPSDQRAALNPLKGPDEEPLWL